jgi:predicted phosphodiesterase
VHGGAKKFRGKFEKLLDPAEGREMEFTEEVAKSNAKNLLLGLPKGDVLVFGHTHRASKEADVINTRAYI